MELQLARWKDPVKQLKELKTQPESYWIRRGERMALKLFHEMSTQVPAYKDFLRKNRIRPSAIQTIQDFKKLPTIDKDNYLRKYSLPALSWGGKLVWGQWTISTTSGSTGEPFYFPHGEDQTLQYAAVAELYLLTNFEIDKRSTLYVNAFPMGAWIGGVFTYETIRTVAIRGKYKLSIISPGVHKQEIISAVRKLSPHFEQTIIGCYGPFLKDILDDGEQSGVNWKRYNLKFVFSAEGFPESFRDYVAEKVGLSNLFLDTLNHYGTVDLGTMSYETPISILARRLAIGDKKLSQSLLGERQPTVTQYIPELFFFEDVRGRLICSAFSGLPLVRYDLKDRGWVWNYQSVAELFSSHGLSLGKEARKAGIADTVWHLPFVAVYERDDFSVSFYAFQIYPETIRRALLQPSLKNAVTGKFTMLVEYSRGSNQVLKINVELKSSVKNSAMLRKKIENVVRDQLLKESSEYRETYAQKRERIRPRVTCWEYESPKYFKPGIKQKWVKNNPAKT